MWARGRASRTVYAVFIVFFFVGKGRIRIERHLEWTPYIYFEVNMLQAKTALLYMLPAEAEIVEFDLIPNDGQNSKTAGTFIMEVCWEV